MSSNNNTVDEVLFWKVFHNIYIFNNIINQIPLLSLECKDLTKYCTDNKLKFKNISNLKWFFEREDNEGALKLLKLKIKHKEELDVTNDGVLSLIRECKDIEIIEYIFKNYQTNFIQILTISTCANSRNKVSFDFFINKIEQDPGLLKMVLPISQTTIENALQNCELYFIEKILKVVPSLDDSIKNFIFKLVAINPNSSSIIPFLISNPQYYNL